MSQLGYPPALHSHMGAEAVADWLDANQGQSVWFVTQRLMEAGVSRVHVIAGFALYMGAR